MRDTRVEQVSVGMNMPRVVTLLPSASEIVCALGLKESLVGVSHECDYPPSLKDLPGLTRYRRSAPGQTSDEINADVEAALLDALALYEVDEAKLGELAPDVVITQDLCQVCAVSMDDVQAAVARLAGRSSVEVVSLRPTTLSDVLDDVERVATALGVSERGKDTRERLEVRLRRLRERSANAPKPRVVTVEWMSPIMLGGTWMSEIVEAAGGVAVGSEKGASAPTVTMEALKALEPDVVLLKPCGYTLERSKQEPKLLQSFVEAFPNARVFLADGNAYFNRSGPRLVDSAELLAACLHPRLFQDFAALYQGSVLQLR